MMDDIKQNVGMVITVLILLIVLWIIAMLLCVFVIFIVWAGSSVIPMRFDTTYKTWDNLQSIEFFSVMEGWFINPLQGMFANFQRSVVSSSEFRFVLLLIVVMEVCVMGLALLIGHDKLTVKDIGVDILITFGGAAMLLSPHFIDYFNFAYGILTGAEAWLMSIFRDGILQIMSSSSYINYGSNPTYTVMDMIASVLFDPVVAKRVQTKMMGLLFAGYIHFVPLLAIAFFYCIISAFSVFFAIIGAKIIVLFTLQFIPFFLLFSALNDAKVKVSKNLKSKAESFLWTAVNVGIIQPSLFIIIISFAANFLLFALVLSPLDDLLTFTVYMHIENAWIMPMGRIPIVGKFFLFFVKTYPKAISVNHNHMFTKLFNMIMGVFIFRQMFPMVSGAVSMLCTSSGNAATNLFTTAGGGVFSNKNEIGKVMEPIQSAPVSAVKAGASGIMKVGGEAAKIASSLMGGANKGMQSNKDDKDKKTSSDNSTPDSPDNKDSNQDNIPNGGHEEDFDDDGGDGNAAGGGDGGGDGEGAV